MSKVVRVGVPKGGPSVEELVTKKENLERQLAKTSNFIERMRLSWEINKIDREIAKRAASRIY